MAIIALLVGTGSHVPAQVPIAGADGVESTLRRNDRGHINAQFDRLSASVKAVSELRVRDLAEAAQQEPGSRPEPLPQPTLEALPTLEPTPEMRLKTPEESIFQNGMTIDELSQIALANNPTLVKAFAAVEAARGIWLQVGLCPNPNVAYLGNEIGDQATAGKQGGYIEQEFVRGRKLPLNREIAARDVAIAERNLAAQRMRVLNDVRIQYYNTLIAQRMLEISQDLVGIGERGVKAATDLFEAKETSRIDVLQSRIEVNNASIALTNARNRQEAAWRRLAALIGVPGMERSTLQGDLFTNLPEFIWEQSVGRILAESPELASSRIGVDRAVQALRRARVEPIPNVIVQAGPQYDLAAHQTITNVDALISIPLFDYNQGNIRKAQADVRSARAEVGRKELELTSRLAFAFERYANARNQLQKYRDEILPDAREALDLVTNAYRVGESNFLVLLTAQRTYFYTNLAYYGAMRDFWESSVTIDGLLLTDSLQAGIADPSSAFGAGSTNMPYDPFFGK